jgi:DNA-directed RNA polymerase subunit RPC12/RpoP
MKINKKLKEEIKYTSFKCILCGNKFLTQKELSKHQYSDCTGGWLFGSKRVNRTKNWKNSIEQRIFEVESKLIKKQK